MAESSSSSRSSVWYQLPGNGYIFNNIISQIEDMMQITISKECVSICMKRGVWYIREEPYLYNQYLADCCNILKDLNTLVSQLNLNHYNHNFISDGFRVQIYEHNRVIIINPEQTILRQHLGFVLRDLSVTTKTTGVIGYMKVDKLDKPIRRLNKPSDITIIKDSEIADKMDLEYCSEMHDISSHIEKFGNVDRYYLFDVTKYKKWLEHAGTVFLYNKVLNDDILKRLDVEIILLPFDIVTITPFCCLFTPMPDGTNELDTNDVADLINDLVSRKLNEELLLSGVAYLNQPDVRMLYTSRVFQ